MTRNRRVRRESGAVALLAVGALLLPSCAADDATTTTTTPSPVVSGAPTATDEPGGTDGPVETDPPAVTDAAPRTDAPPTTPPAVRPWEVDTSHSADADAVDALIDGVVEIGSVMPLTGGVAAAAFAPVADGFRAYIDHANEQGVLGDLRIELSIEDDQYDEDLTPAAVDTLIDGGVDLVAGLTGSPNISAVRDTLNERCIPQLNVLTGSPEWGDVTGYPWTTGLIVPYTVESKVYAARLRELHPDGATVALFYVDGEVGRLYAEAFRGVADEYGLEVVDEQTVDAAATDPPISQIAELARLAPDAIVAAPLGAGCIGFLTELGAASLRSSWTPDTFITSSCASSRILAAAGPSADGVFTSGNLRDPSDPDDADHPGVREFVEYMTRIGKQDAVAAAGVGWTAAEVTVAIIDQAMDSAGGLTRASIIEAARNLTFVPSLGRDGVELRSAGEADPFLAESLQVLRYDAGTGGAPGTFTAVGDLITEFETG